MGNNRKRNVKIIWSSGLSYVIGLMATDGNLSQDGRHLNITSKDESLLLTAKKCLGIKNKLSMKGNGSSKEKRYYVLQFGDINFYEFLLEIGLSPNKSKTIGKIDLPKKYFRDFLRGCIDGDGNINIFTHKESKQPQLRLRITSASNDFVFWLKNEIRKRLLIKSGWIYNQKTKNVFVLSYGKQDTIKILKFVYYKSVQDFLYRKYKTAKEIMGE